MAPGDVAVSSQLGIFPTPDRGLTYHCAVPVPLQADLEEPLDRRCCSALMPALSSLSDVLTLLDAVVGHRGAVKRLTDRFGSVGAPRQRTHRAYLGSPLRKARQS
jgi:hypothetical protein